MHNKGEFIHRLQADVGLLDRDEAEKILSSVLTTLRGRLTPGEAAHVEAQLPEDLKPVWRGNVLQDAAHKLIGSDKLNFDQFMDKIAQETGLTRQRAEDLTKAVFHLLKETITEGEGRDLMAQLPKRLQVAWLDA
jgi:uncharacterized protein (DUF2267 family)